MYTFSVDLTKRGEVSHVGDTCGAIEITSMITMLTIIIAIRLLLPLLMMMIMMMIILIFII